MNLTITKDNVHLLLPGKIASVSAMYADDHNCSIVDAMMLFYASATYRNLQDESTKFWHYGPVALYEIWCDEELVDSGSIC